LTYIVQVISDQPYFGYADVPVDFELKLRIVLFGRVISWESFGQGLNQFK